MAIVSKMFIGRRWGMARVLCVCLLRDIPNIPNSRSGLVAKAERLFRKYDDPLVRREVECWREIHAASASPYHNLPDGQTWVVVERSHAAASERRGLWL